MRLFVAVVCCVVPLWLAVVNGGRCVRCCSVVVGAVRCCVFGVEVRLVIVCWSCVRVSLLLLAVACYLWLCVVCCSLLMLCVAVVCSPLATDLVCCMMIALLVAVVV